MKIAVALCIAMLVACAPSPVRAQQPSAPKPAFTGAPFDGERYSNLGPFRLPTLANLARWYWDWTLAGGTKPPAGGYAAIPVDRPDLAYLRANRADTTVTWIGHATVLLQLAGLNVVTDPQFSQSASPSTWVGPK